MDNKSIPSYFKIILLRDLIYSDNIFKKYIKMIIKSGLYRYKIIQIIKKLNCKENEK